MGRGATNTATGDKFNQVGYGYNEYMAAWRYQLSGGYYVPAPISVVLKPAETMIIADKGNSNRYYLDTRVTWVASRPGLATDTTNADGRASIALDRHNEGANCGFADGHAKWLKGSNIPADNWDGTFVPPPHATNPTYASREIQVPSQTGNVFWNPDCPW
jgi:prepilin-type processing-associated H-X9-DG protein